MTAVAPHAGQPVVRLGPPIDTARAALIMVHGRGAAPRDIVSLAPYIAGDAVAVLGPAATGNTWYPFSFMAPTAQNEPGITSGISVVHSLIDEALAAGIPSERIMLLGFSQGACLAGTSAQRRPMRYGGVFMLSGGLIGPPGASWSADGSFDGTPVFLGCSDIDPHIPEPRVRESAAHFERMGAKVECRIYPGMGHLVIEDEIAFVKSVVEAVTSAA